MNQNTHFVIGIQNKIPYKISGPDYIVTDNSDYTLELVPDGEWDGLDIKTIIYAYDNGTAIYNPVNGNMDAVPVLHTSGNLHIGVTAGDIRTTTWVSVPIRGSIRRKAGSGIKPPTPNVYDQIMDLLNHKTGIKSVEIQEEIATGEAGVGENRVYFLVIREKGGREFRVQLPDTEVDPERVVILQKGPPTETTEGIKNQLLIDVTSGILYVCTGTILTMGEYTFVWKPITGAGSVKYDTPQSLTEPEQAQARSNIDAASPGEVLQLLIDMELAPVLVDDTGTVLADDNGILLNLEG